MNPQNNVRIGLVSAAAFLLLTGCAVLTVDVDVYKGALANHEDVQTEQLVSMVNGAKPLLIQLRDRLEWSEPPLLGIRWRPSRTMQTRLSQARQKQFYNAGFIRLNDYPFTNEAAIRVNGILSLYEERTGSELAPLIEEGLRALNDYEQSYHTFRPLSPAEEKESWLKMTLAFRSRTEMTQAATAAGFSLPVPEKLIEAYSNLFIQPPKGNRDNKAWSANTLRNATTPLGPSANEHFQRLTDRSFVDTDAAVLFPTNSIEHELFIQRAEALGKSFLESRRSLHRLLRLALTGLSYQSDSENQARLRGQIVTLVANIIQPTLLQDALSTNPSDAGPVANRVPGARDIMAKAGITGSTNWRITLAKIHDLLETNPVAGSLALMQIDSDLVSSGIAKYRFGLVRGPVPRNEDGGDELLPEDAYRTFEEMSDLVAVGLERGRLDKGLETLVENYLKASYDNPKNSERVRRAREQLMDAVINFAQKVLFLSNYSTLFDNTAFWEAEAPELREYLLVLQAVGNSLLVNADELRHQEAHTKGQQARLSATSNAVARLTLSNGWLSGASGAKDVIEQLTMALRLEYIRELTTNDTITLVTNRVATFTTNHVVTFVTNITLVATNATNNISTNFSVSVSETVTPTSSTHAKSLLAAIEAATELRAGEIYLRPASAYLRNSYPATSLQNNAPLEWRNMLSEHARHQLPFIGSFEEDMRNRKATREIDKQFWQNVNRVRVSGAGGVNYVIAKDDVGNWYVKQFSTQVSNVVNSAKNLAFFAAGPSLGANLPIHKTDGTADFKAGTTTGASGPSLLDRQFDKAHADYTNETARLYDRLVGTATHLVQTRFVPVWKASLPEVTTITNSSNALTVVTNVTVSTNVTAATNVLTVTNAVAVTNVVGNVTNVSVTNVISALTNVVPVTNLVVTHIIAVTNAVAVTNVLGNVTNVSVTNVISALTNVVPVTNLVVTNIIAVTNAVAVTNVVGNVTNVSLTNVVSALTNVVPVTNLVVTHIIAITNLVVPGTNGIALTNLPALDRWATDTLTNVLAAATKSTNDTVAAKMDELLKALKRYPRLLENGKAKQVTADGKTNEVTPQVHEAALKAVRAEVREVLKDFIRQREAALARYEFALNLIGGSTGP